MKQFIKVMATEKNENGDVIGCVTELIGIEQLLKVVKWNGSNGHEICFEWYDEVRQQEIQWVYDCCSSYARDVLFDKYEKMLCGAVIVG